MNCNSFSILFSLLLLLSSFLVNIHGRHESRSLSSSVSPAPTPSSDSAAAAPAPTPGSDNSGCSTIIYEMVDCLSYLSGGSTDLKPTKSCCQGFNAVLQYNPDCLCFALESSRQLGVALNDTRSVELPTLCKATITPPNCETVAADAPAPSLVAPSVSPVSPSTPPSGSPPAALEEPTLETNPAATAPSPSGVETLSASVSIFAVLCFTLVRIFI